MPNLYITEFSDYDRDFGWALPITKVPGTVESVVAFTTAASVQSVVFGPKTKAVRINTDANAHLSFGDDPTATTSNLRMPADSTEYFAVTPGQRLAVRGS